jgi:hypothetical protein
MAQAHLAASRRHRLLACPGSLSDPAAFEDAGLEASGPVACSASNVPATIFAADCTLSGCHSTASQAASLDLQSAGVYARLSGHTASGGPGNLIDPSGDPSKSVLYEVLGSSPPFGAQMPLTGTKLDAAQLACVAAWITAGGGGDAGVVDATLTDAVVTGDATSGDSATPDAGAADTQAPADAGHDTSTPHDTGAPDTSTADAGAKDSGAVDAGTHDASAAGDAGDAGVTDAADASG